MLVMVAATLVLARSQAWEQAEQQAENVQRAVSEDVKSQITLYSRMLDIAQGFLEGPELEGLPPDLTSGMLARMARDFEAVGVIIVLDANGFSVADSAGRSKRTDNFADRPYFAVHQAQDGQGLYISPPYQSRLRSGDPSFALSRRISNSRGEFAGVVVVAIRLAHFQALFSSINLGPKSTISLVNGDGIVMMRQPSSDANGDVGKDVSASASFREIKNRGSGVLVANTSIDGVERLISFRELTDYRLLVNVSLSTEEILDNWWRQTLLIGGTSLCVGLALVFLALKLQGKVHELEKAKAVLAELRGVAEASNQTSFDQALLDTLAVVQKGTASQWGIAFRFDANGAASSLVGFPSPANEEIDLRGLIAEARTRSEPVVASLSNGRAPAMSGTLIPVHNGKVATAALFLAGLHPTRSADIAKYVQEQLSRTAERDRILVSLNDSLARHSALFVSANDGIITINESGTVESLNPAAEQMFSYEPHEADRHHFGRLLEGVWLPTASPASERTKSTTQEAHAIRKDGSKFPVEASLSVMDLGGRKAFVAFVRDISERRRVERLQSEFVSTVSHELRTPLTSIGGSLGLIAGGAAGPVSEQASRLINIAHSNSQRLVRLVNDILDIEKLQSGQMSFTFAKIDLALTVDSVIAANRGFAEAHWVHFERKANVGSTWVWADGDRIVQALTNVVSNAVKFSPRGGLVSIALSVHGDQVRVSVRDQGHGIPDEFRSRIFERFAQADSSEQRKVGGSGLGLSIARDIISRHGGEVSFESSVGRGTTFHLDVPAFRAASAEPFGPAAPQEGPRILVCAEGASVTESVRDVLGRSGFRAEPAINVSMAVHALVNFEVSAVVIDTAFAGGQISAVVRSLQAQVGKQLPIIVLSLGDEIDPSEVYGLPTMSWIASSADVATLPAIVCTLLKETESARPKILHVEDDHDVAEVVRRSLERDFLVHHASSLEEARRRLEEHDYRLILLDLTLADGRGTELLPALINRLGERIPTVVFSAEDNFGALGPRVEAVLTKSRENLATLVEAVHSVLAESASETLSPAELDHA